MRVFISLALVALATVCSAGVVKRDNGFSQGDPINYQTGKGAPHSGGTNHALDLQNPDGLGQQSTDAGTVPNLKWSFSLSKTKIFPGGWTRTQVSQDLPQNHDIAGAQQHLKKGAIRELHWHKSAEWGFVYTGEVIISAVDEHGAHQVEHLKVGDIWYFPKGVAHVIQGVADENEYLLAFDIPNFDDVGVTFMITDWVAKTPKSVLAKNFGVNESVFANVPTAFPYILNSTVTNDTNISGGAGVLSGNSSFVYRTFDHAPEPAPGNGGTWWRIDSTNFPAAQTLAATYVILKPGGLRELHWHPNAEEWLYFHSGYGRSTVFIGNGNSRTFDFQGGDTAVFPDNSGHYIENVGTEDLIYIELYKSSRVADIPLSQWLALTPSDIVASVLKIPISVVEQIKTEKQVLISGVPSASHRRR